MSTWSQEAWPTLSGPVRDTIRQRTRVSRPLLLKAFLGESMTLLLINYISTWNHLELFSFLNNPHLISQQPHWLCLLRGFWIWPFLTTFTAVFWSKLYHLSLSLWNQPPNWLPSFFQWPLFQAQQPEWFFYNRGSQPQHCWCFGLHNSLS